MRGSNQPHISFQNKSFLQLANRPLLIDPIVISQSTTSQLLRWSQSNGMNESAVCSRFKLSGVHWAGAKLVPQRIDYHQEGAPAAVTRQGNNLQQSPGQTSTGRPTNQQRRPLGPSGKPMIHQKNFPTMKAAKDAARNAGNRSLPCNLLRSRS